ncbi:lysophospholipid acyltransferase family protein [Rhodoblastus sp.]|uniref:lysophospholipid acyltransferase family protein n=1 Tax=Rhodoblastus sp. TaxID=1962975 RepID=UPI0035AE5F3F
MLIIRSLLFNFAFYLVTAILAIGGLPTILFGRRAILGLARLWAHATLWLLDVLCGMKVEFRGLENLRGGHGVIIASKHQSAWETIALVTQVEDFTYILKRELTFIPLFGQYLLFSNQIAINRASRSAALRELVDKAGAAVKEGRAIFIFPEGTRRPAGAPPLYKSGVNHLYAATRAPCVPVALNSGLFWPRRTFLRRPGTVLVEFLPVIPAGLPHGQFAKILKDGLEKASDRLIAEALAKDPGLAVNLEKDSCPAPATN